MAEVNSSKIRFAPNGAIYIAPAGGSTVLPTAVGDGNTAPTGYKALGYVDEGGVTITPTIETNPVPVWQSAVPVIYNVTGASFQISATLMETNQLVTELFFGAPWVAVVNNGTPTGTYRLDLDSSPELDEISIVVDWSQKNVLYRCVVGRAMISERGAIQLQRAENGKYELTIQALDSNGSLGYLLTNDDILEEAEAPVTP